jgi:hypothetical protein
MQEGLIRTRVPQPAAPPDASPAQGPAPAPSG